MQNYLNEVFREAESQNFGANDYLYDAGGYWTGGGKGPEYKPPEDMGGIVDDMDD